jgi:hypothetical protein
MATLEDDSMFALDGPWNVLRSIAGHAVRVLAALEHEGLLRQACRNAAEAAAVASAERREADEADRWVADRPLRRAGNS